VAEAPFNPEPVGIGAQTPFEPPVPALPYIARDGTGAPYLQGTRCTTCAAVLLGRPRACSRCGERRALLAVALGATGRLHTYTIVARSFPEVVTPFVTCVVDLDGGGSVKGTLRGVAPTPDPSLFGLPVELVFGEAQRGDAAGRRVLAYHFVPRRAAA
jgi:uncharacterized protein